MIQARCLQKSNRPLINEARRPLNPRGFVRNSTALRTTGAVSWLPKARSSLNPPSTPCIASQWQPTRFARDHSVRFASTATSASSIADIQPEFSPPSTTPISSEPELLSSSLDSVTSSVPPPVSEHIGYLKELGLDYGWGPTAMIEWALEHVHVYAGTPWWASIGLTVLLLRTALLRFYFKSADMSARNLIITRHNEPLMAKFNTARQTKDMVGANKAMLEMKDLRASAGIKLHQMFMPMALQLPFGYGLFRLMRGMSHLPVPGFDTGGLLWMKDLTLSDPYFFLPVATGLSYWYSFKVGGEAGSSTAVNPKVQRIFLYVLPPISALIMMGWPGALQLTFFIQAIISMTQAAALRQDWFRRIVGIQPLPKPEDLKPKQSTGLRGNIRRPESANTASEAKNQGILGGAKSELKGSWAAATQWINENKPQQGQGSRRTQKELQHAKAYDERKRRELAQLKFEREQEEAVRRVEEEDRKREQRERQRR